jgi:hypothetical protein
VSLTIPPLPPMQVEWPDFQVWWQLAKTGIEQNVNGIEAILDPDNLTPDKKSAWIFQYSVLTGEQSDLDAKATSYGITTEKTNYDNALSALATYLATLATPVLWNDETGNTTIAATTFRSNFSAVLTAKQALLDKMHDSARTLANTAQSTANTVTQNDAITASYTAPGTILTATDAGSNATITVAAHNRVYGDIGNVSVNGGTITGLSYSTVYYVYYDQTSRAGGTVTYVADTNVNHALPNKAAGRHYCGSVTTPASGGGSTSGGASAPAAGGGVSQSEIHSTL